MFLVRYVDDTFIIVNRDCLFSFNENFLSSFSVVADISQETLRSAEHSIGYKSELDRERLYLEPHYM